MSTSANKNTTDAAENANAKTYPKPVAVAKQNPRLFLALDGNAASLPDSKPALLTMGPPFPITKHEEEIRVVVNNGHGEDPFAKLAKEIIELKNQSDKHAKDLKNHADKHDKELKNQADKHDKEINVLNGTVDRLNGTVTTQSADITGLNGTVDRLNGTVTGLEGTVNTLQVQANINATTVQACRNRIRTLENEIMYPPAADADDAAHEE